MQNSYTPLKILGKQDIYCEQFLLFYTWKDNQHYIQDLCGFLLFFFIADIENWAWRSLRMECFNPNSLTAK